MQVGVVPLQTAQAAPPLPQAEFARPPTQLPVLVQHPLQLLGLQAPVLPPPAPLVPDEPQPAMGTESTTPAKKPSTTACFAFM